MDRIIIVAFLVAFFTWTLTMAKPMKDLRANIHLVIVGVAR